MLLCAIKPRAIITLRFLWISIVFFKKLLQLLISSEIGLFWGGTHLTAFVIVQSFNLRLSSIVPAYLPLEKLNLFIVL